VEKHIAVGVKRCTYYMMQLSKEERPENMNTRKKANQLGGLR